MNLKAIFLITVGVIFANDANADFLGDVAIVVIAPVIAPTAATIDIIKGDDPAKRVRDNFRSAGRIIQRSSNQFQKAINTIRNAPRSAIRTHLGRGWADAFDLLNGHQRVQFEMAMTSSRFLGRCLQGQQCNLQTLKASPLAAVLRDAYKIYASYCIPLHPRLGRVLIRAVPPQVVSNARICIGSTPNYTVPGFLNAGHRIAGRGHAVTVENLMIFSRHLNFNDPRDWNWLLHELRHIEQYMRFSTDVMESIDGFAVRYVGHFITLERDAQNAANSWQRRLDQVCRFIKC